MKDTISREPVVTAFVVAAAALAAAFGFEFDQAVLDKGSDVVFAALAIASIFKARSKVSPV